jgi:hypothetical protein
MTIGLVYSAGERYASMAKAEIRVLKRAIAYGASAHASKMKNLRARESALQLLARSIRFGHHRLALIRLGEAVRAHAEVIPEQWAYCEETVARGMDITLHEMLAAAKRQSAIA